MLEEAGASQLQDCGTPLTSYDPLPAKMPDAELTEEAHFHVGDTITSVSKSKLIEGGAEVVLYSTIAGAIGIALSLSPSLSLSHTHTHRHTHTPTHTHTHTPRRGATTCERTRCDHVDIHESSSSYDMYPPPHMTGAVQPLVKGRDATMLIRLEMFLRGAAGKHIHVCSSSYDMHVSSSS